MHEIFHTNEFEELASKCAEDPKTCGCLGNSTLCLKVWKNGDFYHPFCYNVAKKRPRIYNEPHVIKSCLNCPSLERLQTQHTPSKFRCKKFDHEVDFCKVLDTGEFPEFCQLEIVYME